MEYLDDFQGFTGISVRSREYLYQYFSDFEQSVVSPVSPSRSFFKTLYVCRMAKTGISEKSDFWEIEFEFLLFEA